MTVMRGLAELVVVAVALVATTVLIVAIAPFAVAYIFWDGLRQ